MTFNKNQKQRKKIFQFCLIILGVAFIMLGIYFSQPLDIFRKAIFICMECIGIG